MNWNGDPANIIKLVSFKSVTKFLIKFSPEAARKLKNFQNFHNHFWKLCSVSHHKQSIEGHSSDSPN